MGTLKSIRYIASNGGMKVHTYIHIVSQVHKFCQTTVGHETCQEKKTLNTNKTNDTIQTSILQSPKSNTVYNIIIIIIIKQYNTNCNKNNLSY